MSNETDYKILLGTYQQKSFDLFNQVIALEARVSASNQTIEVLNKQVTDLVSELENQKNIVRQLKIAEMERIEEEKLKQKQLEEQLVSNELHFGLVASPTPVSTPKRKTKKQINSAEVSNESNSDKSAEGES